MFFPCWTRTRGPVSTPGPFTRCSWNWPRLLDRAPTQVMDGHRALHADHMNLRYTEYLDFRCRPSCLWNLGLVPRDQWVQDMISRGFLTRPGAGGR